MTFETGNTFNLSKFESCSTKKLKLLASKPIMFVKETNGKHACAPNVSPAQHSKRNHQIKGLLKIKPRL